MPEVDAKLWRTPLWLLRLERANRQTSAKSCAQNKDSQIAAFSKH